jgi:hypothetical protein
LQRRHARIMTSPAVRSRGGAPVVTARVARPCRALSLNFVWGASMSSNHANFRPYGITMEVNQLKRQLKDLGERIDSLRRFL